MNVQVHHGDCLDVLRAMAERGETVHACVTDPPYHLTSIVKRFGSDTAAPVRVPKGGTGAYARASRGFMGKRWDGGDVAFRAETWAAVADVLPPGGHLVVCGGTRTHHRVWCAVEDAGFEVRDTIAWLYGSGFPKSHNLDGEREGWGTALKPALEPILLARKPLAGTVAANVLAHRTGALNVDGCRVPVAEGDGSGSWRNGRSAGSCWSPGRKNGGPEPEGRQNELGRWPANVVHDGSPDVLQAFAAFGEAPGQQAPVRPNSGTGQKTKGILGTFATNSDCSPRNDTGTAARFFYCAKATAADRAGSKHPTVKPIALMRWLVRLVTPPGGIVLDPFAGSGTTGEAALREGFRAVLIEREAEYVADINRRLARMRGGDTPLLAGAAS